MVPKMWHGILNINKERGMTSHQVVASLRQILRQKAIGHTGTLDPEATGVLVVGLGQATRSFPFLDETMKRYQAEIVLGQATDTQDATGIILSENREVAIRHDSLLQTIERLTGNIEQIPPMYSAVKVQGRKLYDLARRGEVIEREARLIKVYQWEFLNPKDTYKFCDKLPVRITCSKGTYIRTLIHDLGELLGCGAHMGSLVRLQSGAFRIEDSITLATVKELLSQDRLGERLVTINHALNHFESLSLDDEDIAKVRNGGKISSFRYPAKSGTTVVRVIDRNSTLIAIAELQNKETHNYWQPIKVFRYE